MADTLKAIIPFLSAVVMTVICSCGKSEPDSQSEVKPNTECVSAIIDSASVEANTGVDQALMQWENCITREYIQKPSMFSIISYLRSNVSHPELISILIKRFLSDNKNGVQPLSKADLYQIASGVPFNIITPSEPAPGKSYFTDSSCLFILEPNIESEGFSLELMWRYPLQDWCSYFSDSTPVVSFDSTSNMIVAAYTRPVPVTFICENGVVSTEISTIQWSPQNNGSQNVLTINQQSVIRYKLMGMIISKVPVSIDTVSVSRQSWCSWSIDINRDSVADLRTITSGDTLTDKGKVDIFAQINIDGQWITTDYKIGCQIRAYDDGSGIITRTYSHREWNVWNSYSMGTDMY